MLVCMMHMWWELLEVHGARCRSAGQVRWQSIDERLSKNRDKGCAQHLFIRQHGSTVYVGMVAVVCML